MTNRTRPKSTRRRFLQSVAAGAAIACAPGLARAAGSFNWKRFAGTRLRFLLDSHPWTTGMVPPRLPEFEKLTGIKVDWQVYPEDQFRQKLTLDLRSDPSSVDGYMSLTSWDGEAFWAAGWYEPIEKFVRSAELTNPQFDIKDFFPNTLKIASMHGTLIGVPLYPEVQLLYYDKEKFAKHGVKVPQTITEFIAAAKSLEDKKTGYAGYVSRGEGLQAVYTIAPFLFAEGGSWLDAKRRPLLDSDAFVKALHVYSGTLHDYGPPGIAGMSWYESVIVFAQANAAMFTDSSNFVSIVENPKKSKLAGRVGYAMMPKGPAGRHSTLISWALSINAKSHHKEAAWYLIQWLVSKDMEEEMAKQKIPVGRQSVWNGADFQKLMPKAWLDSFVGELPGAAVNQANPLVVPVPQVRDAIGRAIVAVIEGGKARPAAEEAQKEVLQILKMT